jgi:hypothetical protein
MLAETKGNREDSLRRRLVCSSRGSLVWDRSKGIQDQTNSAVMRMRRTNSAPRRLVVCIRNTGFPASLEPCKIYRCLGAVRVGSQSLLRIVDESGQAYLYSKSLFAPVRVSSAAQRALALAG